MSDIGFNLGTARGRIDIDTSDLQKLGTAAHQVGLGLTAIGAAALAGFGVAVGAAAEFEQKIDHFGAVTGATQEELKQVGDLALEMGRTTVFSANEAAGAMVELGKAGFSTKEILAGIGPAVASLAAAGDLPLTRSTEILANTIRTFGLEAKDAVYVADQLAGAANASTTEVEDLAVSLRYTGGVAAALGVPLHDVADALAILGNNGIKGSTAGTTLRRILLELNPATKKQTEALMELGIIQENANFSAEQLAAAQEKVLQANNGVASAQERVNSLTEQYARAGAPATAAEAAKRAQELALAQDDLADAQENAGRVSLAYENTTKGLSNAFFDANGKAKSLAEIFQIVEDRTKHLNEAEKQRTLDIIFGSRAVAGALILAREGAEGFEEISAQIEKVSAADVASARLDNLSGSLRRLKNILITEMVESATPLLNILNSLVEFATRMVTSFGGLPEPIKQVSLVALALFGVMATLGGGMLLLVSFIARGVRAFKELKAIMIGTNVAKVALDTNVPILAGRFGILTRAIQILLSPFKLLWSLIVAAVTAIAGVLGISVGWVVAIIAIVAIIIILIVKVKAFRDFLIELGKIMFEVWIFMPKLIISTLLSLGKTFLEVLGNIVGVVGSALPAVGRFFASLPGLIGGAISTALGYVGNFLLGVGNFLMQLPAIVLNWLGQAALAFFNFLTDLPMKLAFATGFIIGAWIRLWITFFSTITEWTAKIVVALIGFGVSIVAEMVTTGINFLSAVVEFMTQLPGIIGRFLAAAFQFVVNFAIDTWNKTIEVGSNVISAVIEWFSQLPGVIAEFLSQAYARVTDWADRTWDRTWQMGSDVLSAVVEWFSQLPGRLAGLLSDAFNAVISWGNDMWTKAREIASDFYNGVIDGISGLPGVVVGILDRVIDAFLGVINRAWNAAKNLAGALWNGFKAGLGISSPSFIERAMWALTDNVGDSIKDLKGQIGTIQAMAEDFANPMSVNFNSPAAMEALRAQIQTTAAQAGNIASGAATTFNNEFHTDADPVEISQQIMWDQRVRVR